MTASARVRSRPLAGFAAVLLVTTGLLVVVSLASAPRTPVPTEWLYYAVGLGIAAILCVVWPQRELWLVQRRQIILMLGGALLYGLLSFSTNTFLLPSAGQVTLRPAVIVPIFFGLTFGPAVGFFTGAAGNILGDALTGWGVYPVWDAGNGLMGMLPGLILALQFIPRRRTVLIPAALTAMLTLLALAFGDVSTGSLWTVRDWWPVLFFDLALLIVIPWLTLPRLPALALAVVAGALAVFVSMGYASFADVLLTNASLLSVVLGVYVPVIAGNLALVVVLIPLLVWARETLHS